MIRIDGSKCNLCMNCSNACPFDAIAEVNNEVSINSNCKLCKLCIKACPQNAMALEDIKKNIVDKGAYGGILVYAEHNNGVIHPVTYELIGEAMRLAAVCGYKVNCLLAGYGILQSAEVLRFYGLDNIYVYEHPELKHFRADSYANIFSDCINMCKPSVVLVGATNIGRSLAPRVAVRFRTGLTADCTKLELRENSDLVQIRPAFGGNIMARIITPEARPQFATVRYKVMKPGQRDESSNAGNIVHIKPDAKRVKSGLDVVKIEVKEKTAGISEAERIVAVGRGCKDKKDLSMVFELAESIGAEVAVTRPLVEAGYLPYTHQIGLSGRTVCPKLIITLGISGAVQFTACMKASDCIIAVNKDRNAQIFNIAHYGIVGDMYDIIPNLQKHLASAKGLLKGE